jgi:hypothetical protein
MRSTAKSQALELPPLSFRAAVESIDDENRTVELVWSTGAPVDRMDWWTGKRYLEKLSLDPAHVRLERLNAGAPLLDTHSSCVLDATTMLGAVERGHRRRCQGQGRRARRCGFQYPRRRSIRHLARRQVTGIISQRQRRLPGVSRSRKSRPRAASIPVRTATDWEPFEISMVPMPADAGAQTSATAKSRNLEPSVLNSSPSAVPRRPEPQRTRSVHAMKTEAVRDPSSKRNPLDPGAPTDAACHALSRRRRSDRRRDRAQDPRTRARQGIMAACRASRMTTEFRTR